MKILCLSDTHGKLPEPDLDNIDLVLHAGDITLTEKDDYISQLVYFENVFCPWIRRVEDYCPVFYIWGNHETFVEAYKIPSTYNHVTNYHCIHNNWTEYNGLKIAGTSYTPYYGGYAFNEQDDPDGLGRRFSFIPDDTDILISHGPPYGILDYIPGKTIYRGRSDKWIDIPAVNAGSKELKKRIDEIKPKLVVFGHIHNNYGIVIQDGITYVGCSVVDDLMEDRQPIVLEIN